MSPAELTHERIRELLMTAHEVRVEQLFVEADRVRREHVGEQVHFRGLIEISNCCRRACLYCGLRAANSNLSRYRMNPEEVLAAAQKALQFGYGTVVLQSGEDTSWSTSDLEELIQRLKESTSLAVTLSLGEREVDEYARWKAAGADRVLLRFETSDPELFGRIHPSLAGRGAVRLGMLGELKRLGYEVGSGVMVGLPGQSADTLARDILLFAELGLDMVGVGPYVLNPDTPMGDPTSFTVPDQVPATVERTLRVIALTRLLLPRAHIPSTSAVAALDPAGGHSLGLRSGANVIMPNLTPLSYRLNYLIYPGKAFADRAEESVHEELLSWIGSLGRVPGCGAGGRTATRSA